MKKVPRKDQTSMQKLQFDIIFSSKSFQKVRDKPEGKFVMHVRARNFHVKDDQVVKGAAFLGFLLLQEIENEWKFFVFDTLFSQYAAMLTFTLNVG